MFCLVTSEAKFLPVNQIRKTLVVPPALKFLLEQCSLKPVMVSRQPLEACAEVRDFEAWPF